MDTPSLQHSKTTTMTHSRKSFITYIIIIICLVSCQKQPNEHNILEETLNLAGENRHELEKVLAYYRANKKDSLKYKAAFFLITNMRWHDSPHTSNVKDTAFQQRFYEADSIYHHITKGIKGLNSQTDKLQEAKIAFREKFKKKQIPTKSARNYYVSDLKELKAKFLISHIDYIVACWQTSPFAYHLSFDDFCEYLLPYRTMPTGYYMNGKEIADIVVKQLLQNDSLSLQEIILNYNKYITTIREFIGSPCPENYLGWADIFLAHKRECLSQCEFETATLRACGIPTVMNFCIANREFVGRHSYCSILDTTGKPIALTAESDYLGKENWGYPLNYRLNAFQYTYGAQHDSPYMLKDKDELLPPEFQQPTIKEVTSTLRTTVPLTLKVPKDIKNKLIWLYTYNRRNGYIAVTWGEINKKTQFAQFKYVIPGILYFPAYLNKDGSPHFLGEPLFVERDRNGEGHWKKLSEIVTSRKTSDVILTRKFPRKPSMLNLAKDLIGSKFWGSNQEDGSDKEELYCINERPEDHLNEYYIKNPKPYRFYIFEPANQRSEMSIIEYLADTNRHYTSVTTPKTTEIFCPSDTNKLVTPWVKLLPEQPDETPEFDGNVQTTSGREKVIFRLKNPQIVDCIRAVPLNADNIIHPNENYSLFYWEQGWKLYKRQTSQYNYLEFKQLPENRLYWLRNNSRGVEEVPFILQNGIQKFIYYDILKSPLETQINLN